MSDKLESSAQSDEGAEASELPESAADPRIGTIIDKYRIVRLLGQGGMGSVYEAQHVVLGRRFAIKFMLPEFASNRDVLRRFENEAKSAGRLEHPNIAAVTDLGRAQDNSPYLVMEYLSGHDCAKLLERDGPLPPTRAADIVHQSCIGLSVAHQSGIVHRDIKPENLFITTASDGADLVKILDFGIAKLRLPEASAATGSGVAMGTYYYMAPEQVRDAGKVDGRADVWALGVVLYELLTGVKPFDADDVTGIMYKIVFDKHAPPNALRAGLSTPLAQVVNRALEKNADDRFASVVALADALAPFTARPREHPAIASLAEQAMRPPSVSAAIRATTSQASISILSQPRISSAVAAPRRRKVLWLSAAIVALLTLAAVGSWLSRSTRAPNAAFGVPDVSNSRHDPSLLTHSLGAGNAIVGESRATPASASVPLNSAENAVRTTTEPPATRSNKAPPSVKISLHSPSPSPSAHETSAQEPQPVLTVPERQKPNTHNPVSIDTNSPY